MAKSGGSCTHGWRLGGGNRTFFASISELVGLPKAVFPNSLECPAGYETS